MCQGYSQTGKTTAIRRIAVLETSLSRHHGTPLKLLEPSQHYRIEGLNGNLRGP